MKGRLFPLVLLSISLFLAGCAGQSYGANIPPASPTSQESATAPAAAATAVPTAPAVTTATVQPTQAPSPDISAASATPNGSTGSGGNNNGGATTTVSPTATHQIQFSTGSSSYTLVTDIGQDVPQTYTLDAQAGQQLYLEQNGPFSVQVLDPAGNALTGMSSQGGPWGVGLTSTGTYSLKLSGNGHAVLSLYIPPATRAGTVLPALAASQRIAFPVGGDSASVTLNLVQGTPQGLILHGSASQQLSISAAGDATIALIDPQGFVPPPVYSPGHWQFALNSTGDYVIHVMGVGPVTATMTIPAVTVPPTPILLGTPVPSGNQTVTLANRGQTIRMTVGSDFVLMLGNEFDWQVTVENPAIVSRVINITPLRGSQGVYHANSRGTTTLTATGDPACRQSQPPCMMPSLLFEITIVVQ